MRISVIMPTVNRAHIIGRSIESVLAQTYPDVELIVVDDGSTDDTANIVAEYSRNSDRPIVYHWKENGGCATARNKGLQIATGELVAPLDSDDTWAPEALTKLAASLGNADFVYSPAIEVSQGGSEKINYPVACNSPETFAVEHFQTTNVRNGAVLFKRLAVESVGGFDESLRYNEDSDTLQRVAILYKAAYCPTPTVYHRHHIGSKSNDRVEIYRALLRSSENILMRYPQFRNILGEAAVRRINGIKKELMRVLIVAGNFDDAIKLFATIRGRVSVGLRLSLILRSKLPCIIEGKMHYLVRRCDLRPLCSNKRIYSVLVGR